MADQGLVTHLLKARPRLSEKRCRRGVRSSVLRRDAEQVERKACPEPVAQSSVKRQALLEGISRAHRITLGVSQPPQPE